MLSKEKHREYNLKYYHNKRKRIISELGGKCIVCGSTENLEFDHVNKNNKLFGISRRICNSYEHIKPEIDKCVILCRDCHIAKTKESMDNGTKINKYIAISICEEYASSGITQAELGAKYGLSQKAISDIITGRRWGTDTKCFDRTTISGRSDGSKKQCTAVDKIDPDTGTIICTYNSMSEAAKEGYTVSAISLCCSGKKKKHKGYIWKKHNN